MTMIGYVTLGTNDLARAAKFYDAIAAEMGTGRMALQAKDKDQVDRLYAIALANGGSDEGPPGPRGDSFYGGYFRDPDGNKLNAFIMTGSAG
jgi:predicted lactoylglutathione lyase